MFRVSSNAKVLNAPALSEICSSDFLLQRFSSIHRLPVPVLQSSAYNKPSKMQALRLTRNATAGKPVLSLSVQRRCLATATANQVHLSSTASSPSAASASSGARVANIPLSNIEAHWQRLSGEEKLSVHEKLEALQLKDWKELSLEEKRAAYYVAFGPHGPRAPTSQPGDSVKILLSTLALIAAGSALFFTIKAFSPAPPRTMTKEWQEASNERAKEMKINPISGISSEDYKGKGFIQSK